MSGFVGIAGFATSLSAGFTLTGNLPRALAPADVVVNQERHEDRSSVGVAEARIAAGEWHLDVEAGPGLYRVQIGRNVISFVAADDQVLRVETSDANGTLAVRGTPDQEHYLAYENFRKDSLARLVEPAREAASAARRAGDAAPAERLTEEEVAAYDRHRRELNDFTIERLAHSAALYAASLRWDGDHRIDELATVVDAYAAANPGAEVARAMQERIARFRATAVGAVAPALSGPSVDGTTLSLEQLRGKHVLVDFWAGWCPPCRIENRRYAELHARYREAGFEIFAVSVDTNAAAWKRAIRQDGADWLHVSDLTGWKSPLAGAYNVSALPASFLLDPDGRIVAKNVRGARLAELLAELVGP